MVNPLVYLLLMIMHLYYYVLWAWMIMSMLMAFNIVNRYQPAVQKINYALFRLTDPLLRPIRKYMPDLNGIDISPIVLIVIFNIVEYTLRYYSV